MLAGQIIQESIGLSRSWTVSGVTPSGIQYAAFTLKRSLHQSDESAVLRVGSSVYDEGVITGITLTTQDTSTLISLVVPPDRLNILAYGEAAADLWFILAIRRNSGNPILVEQGRFVLARNAIDTV